VNPHCLPSDPCPAPRTGTKGIDPQLVARALCQLGHVRRLDRLGLRCPLDASAGRNSDYACLFGRDSLRMALDLLDDFPVVARTTIARLTALQGIGVNARAEEEPGRILHEYRCDGNLTQPAQFGELWEFPYYGSVDATPLYAILIGAYCERYGRSLLQARVRDRTGSLVTIRDGLERALWWINSRLARDGYICVQRAQPHGLNNQTWEDSYDSHFRGDGRLLDTDIPYAPAAVQGLAYDALLVGAELEQDGRRASYLRVLAAMLRRRVMAEFWLPSLHTFAPALVLDCTGPKPTRVVASSPGHLLDTRLLDGVDAGPRREALICRLLAPDMLAAAGIRTKSTTARRFRPGSYHNGSVWPMDTGVIADGLRRHGHVQEADDLEDRILRACAVAGLPVEFFRGDQDGTIAINTRSVYVRHNGERRRVEQPPQRIQGWTVTRLWRILRSRGALSEFSAPPVRVADVAA
jgi:glycogen debranching enzyme